MPGGGRWDGVERIQEKADLNSVVVKHLGGAAEIVRDEETGLLYREQTASSLAEAVDKFESRAKAFKSQRARQNAERFSTRRFQVEFLGSLELINPR